MTTLICELSVTRKLSTDDD